MELRRPVIKFYQKRTFSEKMSASFDFFKENFKLFFKLCVYLILPVALLQGIFLNSYMGNIMNLSAMASSGMVGVGMNSLSTFGAGIAINLIFIVIFSLIGYSVLASITFSCIQEYNARQTLSGMTFNDLKPTLIKNFKRALIISLISFALVAGIYFILGLLAAITPWTLIVTFPALIAVILPMILMLPIYSFENITIDKTIKKAYNLGFKTWGSLFAIIFIMGLLAGMAQGVATIPWYILTVVKTVFTMTQPGSEIGQSFITSFFQYIFAVIMMFFGYVAYILIYLGLSYHYSSASEATEATSVTEDIDKFETLI